MQAQAQSQTPRPRVLAPQIVRFYCRTCSMLFGKTISLMAGEAQALGRWYGSPSASFINWLLRDPDHCENELRGAKYEWLRAS